MVEEQRAREEMAQVTSDLLEEIVARLARCVQPDRIILFGSRADGEPTESSDIDLLIIVPESNEPRHHRARKAYSCLRGMAAPVELIVLTREEVERDSARARSPLLHHSIAHSRP